MKLCECGCGNQILTGRRFILGHNRRNCEGPNKGKVLSPETKQRISKALKGRVPWNKGRPWASEIKQKISRTQVGRILPLETRQKMSAVHRKRYRDPEVRRRLSEAHKERYKKDPGKKEQISSSLRKWHAENPNPMLGKKHSTETRLKISQKSRELQRDPDYRKKRSEIFKKLWQNPQFREKTISRTLKSLRKRPTKLELELKDILKNLNYPYQYTGDGAVIIAGKNPDFWWEDEKRIIEIFGLYWHKSEDEQRRINHFALFGFECLVIWENELKDREDLIQKIKWWHNDISQQITKKIQKNLPILD